MAGLLKSVFKARFIKSVRFKLLLMMFTQVYASTATGQNYTLILGRPTDNSVTMNVLFDQAADVYWEYGTVTGNYSKATEVTVASKDVPIEIEISGLQPGHKYFYRTRFRPNGNSGNFKSGPEYSFQTCRARGEAFRFAVEADPHLDTNSIPAAYALTLNNITSMNPDFLVDLGDSFMSEKYPPNNQANITARHLLYRPYFATACQSAHLFLALGNHEGEFGWKNDGTPNCLPVQATNIRKSYYPNPLPNGFYSGDTITENYVGLREDYYAWQWGDALFVVLDPYWHTVVKPEWGWTLGKAQYDWFRKTLENSKAKYKFVFCHNLLGGRGSDARGGAEYAGFFEWGGKNADNTWGFDTNRPGWGKPIHQLMVENHVNIFFHGHDHFYGKQVKDGIVYQEVPQPSNRNLTTLQANAYGYLNGLFLPGRGFLLVSVSDTTVKVEYISTLLQNETTGLHHNKEVADSYTTTQTLMGTPEIIYQNAGADLQQNSPNPFLRFTTVTFTIAKAGNISLNIFDTNGNHLARLIDQYKLPGTYNVKIDAVKLSLPEGVVFCQLRCGNVTKSIKMIVSK